MAEKNKDTARTQREAILSAENIRKVYPGTIALKGVDFQVYKGCVNVLVGENGAGKTTLMKIIAGVERQTKGSIFVKGEEVRFSSPRDANERGIGIIYQELNLCPNLDVAENIFLSKEIKKNKINVNHKAQIKAAQELINRLEQPIDSKSLVSELRVGEQQIVEIAKAVLQETEILIMDEPTSALSSTEVDILFNLIDELKKKGVAIVYISHRLEEVLQIGDVITVMRDGQIIAHEDIKAIDLKWIVTKMVGGNPEDIFISSKHEIGGELLRVENLSLPRPEGGMYLENFSFTLHRGEILGLYGLMGAGRTETLECLIGLHPRSRGDIFINGKRIKENDISSRIKLGFALVPEDRQREGLVQTMSVQHNLTLSSLWRWVKPKFHIKKKIEDENVSQMVEELSVKAASPAVLISSLSGGNQQKVVIGKSLLTSPQILLMDDPTRGIDVAAKGEVFRIISKLAKEGLGIIFVTSEIMEIRAVCDRIIVLSKGIMTADLDREDATEEALIDASAVGHKTTSEKLNV